MDEVVTRSRIGAMTYVAPPAALVDEEANAALLGALTACIAATQVQLVIDLGRVTAINGRALEIMLDTHHKLSLIGGRQKLVNLQPLTEEICIATGAADQLWIASDAGDRPDAPPRADRHAPRPRLGEILLERGTITAEQLGDAVRLQNESGKRVGRILVEKGLVLEADMLRALSVQLDLPYVALRPGLYDTAAVSLLDRETARRLEVLPLFKVHDTLTIASADPQAVPVFDEVRQITGCRLRIVLCRREDVVKSLHDAYDGGGFASSLLEAETEDLSIVADQIPDDYTTIDEMAGASPVINLVNNLIQRAIRDKASDIHIEITRGRSRVRFRVDGLLYEVMTPRVDLHPAIVSRLKVMANLDIAERRLPQDGRIQVATQGRTVDLRFSSLPGINGEKVVLRVLDKNQSILDVEKLGMRRHNLDPFKALLGRAHGLILVTGPTGSGKTTTLYAAVNFLKSMETNIVTIEDPVEYQLDIINQNQVNDAIGLTFARMLKHVLRQDPDVVMLGEIRDRATAEIAVQAALTGHLVLSTLHTNDAIGALSRMVDMGIEPYLLASALAGVVAQRLVRHVCGACKTSYLASPELVRTHGWPTGEPVRLVKGRGCSACYDSGYKGRLGIHEVLVGDEALQRVMVRNPTRDALADHFRATGRDTLFRDGLERVLQGSTTLEEVSRVVNVG